MKDILKLGMVLACFATAACVGLAFVYAATKERIEANNSENLKGALAELFPDMEGSKDISGSITSGDPAVAFETIYQITGGRGILGLALQASKGSYGGPIRVLTGVQTSGTISGIKIMEHADTPGLGANAGSPNYFVKPHVTFYGQFAGKAVQDPFQVKGDVDAITAATITSDAVTSIVKASGQAAFAWLNAQGGAQ
ncbi:MAG: FMN-binding protein [Treponema sp.]|jgi:electron transport complex protein RnfG|nr:FMN-binding protein [Treponema sp.]